MSQLFARSVLVLVLLFGLVFAVGAGVLYYYHFPVSYALAFAAIIITLQFILGPFIIDWIYKINWMPPQQIAPEFADFLAELCKRRRIPLPRFGVIEDGNPNAFTYGHVPGDARLVVTRGLLQMLTREEYEAVVAHEVGHIRHYDFIVMTFAALAPLLLYMLYAWSRDRRQGGAAAVAMSVGAYVAYIVSNYVVLFLSRVREYFADEHAAESVADANSISTALVKIAYGLARIPQVDPQQQQQGKKAKKRPALNKSQLMGSLGICNFSSATPMALYSTNAAGQFSTDHMMRAMQWDLWNPWAKLFELQSSHPLVAHRVAAASRIAYRRRQTPILPPSTPPTESYWPSFLVDLIFVALPWIGLAFGLLFAYGVIGRNLSAASGNGMWALSQLRFIFLLGGLGWLLRLAFSYGSGFRERKIVDLVGEVDVSHIRGIPVELEGQIIGRGVPGLFWSKDLVMQDDTGFITLIYQQPLSFIETLFGMFRAEGLVGKKGKIRGWYRRGPSPYLELLDARFEDGDRTKCYHKAFMWFLALAVTAIGVYMTVAGIG